MIAKAAARGVLVATTCSSSAIGTNSANGILKTVDVDLAVTKSPGDSSNAPAIGAREDRRCLWSAPACRRLEKRGRVRAVQKFREAVNSSRYPTTAITPCFRYRPAPVDHRRGGRRRGR